MKRKARPIRPLTASEGEQLMVYGALDNPTRLLAYRILYEEPDIPFNALARKLGVKTGLAAYHLAVLKASGLVEFRYVRRSKATSLYRLTDFGLRWYRRLFGPRGLVARERARARRPARSKAAG
ncbi:MAG TPA: winged helix-turn-helix domain-containing protein [Thermoplasmata archaeon]|nr:winged helix-turn-helix domain-containing protein [Thermoplasmata archaeon]